MTDSERLSTRLNAVVKGRPATRAADPAPVGPSVEVAVAALARKHMTDPSRFRPATDAELAAKDEADRRERRREISDRLMSRIPSKYRQADLKRTVEGTAARRWLQSYRDALAAKERGEDKHPQSLVIMGPKGTGKTWMACALARQLMDPDAPIPTTYTTVSEMLEALRIPSDTDLTRHLFMTTPVLILDDFGAENLTDWAREKLYQLSHNRDHNGLATIVTTNLEGPEIWARYESRTVERLFNGAARIDLEGESLRVLPF